MSSLMRWDPFRGLARVQRDMDRVFDELLGRQAMRWEGSEEGVRLPPVDVSETDDEIIVRAEMPGIEKDKIDIEVLPESLSISAEMSREQTEEKATHHYRERVWGRFERTLGLPAEVVSDEAKATFRDGVLEIRLQKSAKAKAPTPKRVEVA